MGKPHKKTGRKKPAVRVPVPSASQPLVASESAKETAPTKGKIRRVGAHLLSSAWDYALGNVWDVLKPVVTGVVLTGVAALLVYWRMGRAAWLFPWLKYALVFAGGWVALGLVLIILAARQERKRRALERLKNQKFASTEKGFLDHILNQKRGWKEFNSTLPEITKHIRRMGTTSARAGRMMDISRVLLGSHGAGVLHWIATRTASKLNKHAAGMGQTLDKLKTISGLLYESNLGYVQWFSPDTEEKRIKLQTDRDSMVTLLQTSRNVVPILEGFQDSQNTARGISQELNTAANRMVHTTSDVIAFLRGSERDWQQLINIMDTKLNQ